MKNNLISIISVMILVLLSSMTIATSENINLSATSSNILYVGGTGPGNYTSIQDAIDNASNGDTIFVYNGTYYESLFINKSISLIGENKQETIIVGNGSSITINNAYFVNISKFTIKNEGTFPSYGISISNNSIMTNISNNNFIDNSAGIAIEYGCDNCNIVNNYFSSNLVGIVIGSGHNHISNNVFSDGGIIVSNSVHSNVVENNTINEKPLVYLEDEKNQIVSDAGQIIIINCSGITIENLNISNVYLGVYLEDSNSCLIKNNKISKCPLGIYLKSSDNNKFKNNNIFKNLRGIELYSSYLNDVEHNLIHNSSSDMLDQWDLPPFPELFECGLYIVDSGSNTIKNNQIEKINCYGIYLSDLSVSSNNIIYLNNFIENNISAIDNGFGKNNWYYHSKGNYWSDYTGYDNNSDGIGDIPYDIANTNDQDLFPLMEPYDGDENVVLDVSSQNVINFKKLVLIIQNTGEDTADNIIIDIGIEHKYRIFQKEIISHSENIDSLEPEDSFSVEISNIPRRFGLITINISISSNEIETKYLELEGFILGRFILLKE